MFSQSPKHTYTVVLYKTNVLIFFAFYFSSHLMQALDSAMLKLQQIWDRIGICKTQKDERCATVFRHLQSLLDDMVEEEETLEKQIVERVQAFTDELKMLTTELGVPAYHVC